MPLRLDTQLRPLDAAVGWINSGPLSAEALRGRPTLVHFWALSCQSCKSQLPQLGQWQRQYGERLQIVSVHSPLRVTDLDPDRVVRAVHQLGLDHPVALDGDEGALADAYDVHLTPSYFLFDAEGRLRHYHAGVEAADPVARAIERLLGPADHPLPPL
jgi:thiol-disulfide isomerase/thioredoxin